MGIQRIRAKTTYLLALVLFLTISLPHGPTQDFYYQQLISFVRPSFRLHYRRPGAPNLTGGIITKMIKLKRLVWLMPSFATTKVRQSMVASVANKSSSTLVEKPNIKITLGHMTKKF